MAQLRREARADRKARDRERWIEGQSRRPLERAGTLFPNVPDFGSRIRAAVTAWTSAHPACGAASGKIVAIHEAGHYALAEAMGLVAGTAAIRGSSFGRAGWGGSAGALERPVADGRAFDANDIAAEAVFILAGPYAEFALAGGCPHCSPGEFIETTLLAVKLAEMRKVNLSVALWEIMNTTGRLVLGHQKAINGISVRLEQKRHLTRYDRKISEVLARIAATPFEDIPELTAKTGEDLARLFMEAPIDLAAFARALREAGK